MNYPALKDGASNFNGTSKNRGFSSFALANSASVGSTGDSRRYHALGLKADVFRANPIKYAMARRGNLFDIYICNLYI